MTLLPILTTCKMCFRLEEESSLLAGDNILGEGSAVFEDLHMYMSSLAKMQSFNPTRLYCGHGPVVEKGVEKIEEYIRHRMEREKQILGVMQGGGGAGGEGADDETVNNNNHHHRNWTAASIVEVVYAAYPKELWPAATHSVVLHLRKLEQDGVVVQVIQDAGTEPEGSVNTSDHHEHHVQWSLVNNRLSQLYKPVFFFCFFFASNCSVFPRYHSLFVKFLFMTNKMGSKDA